MSTKINPVAALGPRYVTGKMNEKSLTSKLQNVRLAFVRLDSPNTGLAKTDSNGEPIEGNYEATILIPEKKFQTIFNALKSDLEKMLKINKTLATPEQKLKALKNALTIGGEGAVFKNGADQMNKEGKIYDGLEGHYTMKIKSKAVKSPNGDWQPKIAFKIVDKHNQNIPAHSVRDELYSGCWADCVFTLSPYEYMKKTGITVYISGVMKIYDDTKLGGSDPFGAARDDIQDAATFDGDGEEISFDEKPSKKKGKAA